MDDAVRQAIRGAMLMLDEKEVPYMVVGSFSSNQWGIPRATKDMDLVLLSDAPVALLAAALAPLFQLDPQLGPEPKSGKTKYLFRSKQTEFEVEAFVFKGDPFDLSRFSRRVQREDDGLKIWFQTAEDVIVQKLNWARPKDIADVVDILTVQLPEALDLAYIEKWCAVHGTLGRWRQAKLDAGWDGV